VLFLGLILLFFNRRFFFVAPLSRKFLADDLAGSEPHFWYGIDGSEPAEKKVRNNRGCGTIKNNFRTFAPRQKIISIRKAIMYHFTVASY